MSDRRREGVRVSIASHDPSPRVRVTAHAGDKYQPAPWCACGTATRMIPAWVQALDGPGVRS